MVFFCGNSVTFCLSFIIFRMPGFNWWSSDEIATLTNVCFSYGTPEVWRRAATAQLQSAMRPFSGPDQRRSPTESSCISQMCRILRQGQLFDLSRQPRSISKAYGKLNSIATTQNLQYCHSVTRYAVAASSSPSSATAAAVSVFCSSLLSHQSFNNDSAYFFVDHLLTFVWFCLPECGLLFGGYSMLASDFVKALSLCRTQFHLRSENTA